MAKKAKQINDGALWYKDAIIYELHIKAFMDSNGDGIGDFKGLLQKLDYLEELGVTAIWLLPFYPSPLRDDGYDIADYTKINPTYGDLKDFKKFLDEAHNRGLKVITELVINHTSDQHPWFQRARKAPKGSKERDFYVWSDDPSKYKDVRIIFTDYEASNWTWDQEAQQYYWHRFFHHQPDLNYDNPEVQQEVFRVLDYWMDMGVDGFRLDAVPYLFEREGTNGENLPETHHFLKKLRKHVDEKYENRLLLAEANMWPEDSASYFGNGDECHMNYHFPIMPRLFMSVKMEDRYPIIDIFDQTPAIPENCQWAMFLRNHDELTLEMVTDEERDYMYKVYTKDPLARINLGIRHRLAPLLDNNRQKIELMNVLLFSLPGTPVLYYGDEIGMGDNFYLGDRDGVRTPMQWTPDRNAGFSEANPQRLYLPVILDPEYSYESVNVETQQRNNNSLLWWTRRIINMRKRFLAFGRGEMKFLSPQNSKVLAFIREYKDEKILVIANLSRFAQAVELDLSEYVNYVPSEVFSQNSFPTIKDDPYLFTIGPHGYYWFILKSAEVTESAGELLEQPVLQLEKWVDVLKQKNLEILANRILPVYLKQCRWFGGKARVIQKINIEKGISFPTKDGSSIWLIFEVNYNEGLPEVYQLPIKYYVGKKVPKDVPHCIAKINIGNKEGFLYDAVYSNDFQVSLFSHIANNKKTNLNGTSIHFHSKKEAATFFNIDKEETATKVLGVEQSNTSFIFGDKYFLKIYRKLDRTVNPDVEITKFLTERAKLEHVPKFIGAIEREDGSGPSMVMGMMQEVVPNQGDSWEYIKDSVSRYFERVMAQHEMKAGTKMKGDLYNPAQFEQMPEALQNMIGGAYVERVLLLGQRTAEMHIALASDNSDKDFKPEDFSLHYQRSLFSSLQSLVRSTMQTLDRQMKNLPANIRHEAQEILKMRGEILDRFKLIFDHKIDTKKIRTHGDFHLGQVLFTGKDFVIIDFEGEPARSFSERRLKRSPLRDVAGMIRSFHYAAYNGLFSFDGLAQDDKHDMEKWADQWYHYISGFYFKSYLQHVLGHNFIPEDQEDLKILMQTFLLEKAVYELNYELNNRPDWALIPIRGIKSIMRRYSDGETNKKGKK